jgi:hypothetical protein
VGSLVTGSGSLLFKVSRSRPAGMRSCSGTFCYHKGCSGTVWNHALSIFAQLEKTTFLWVH